MDDSATHLSHLDAYCERAGDPALWAEPLNAITNLAFIAVAYLALRDMRQLSQQPFTRVGDIWVLIFALFAIGLGSGLWHTVATRWAVIADVLPITLFINVYIFSVFRRIIGWRWSVIIGLWAGFQALTFWMQTSFPPDFLHGTVMYLPTYLMLIGLIAIMATRQMKECAAFTAILLIWTLSLAMRTADIPVCDIFPHGTHFLWHLLNAVVLYALLAQLMRTLPRRA